MPRHTGQAVAFPSGLQGDSDLVRAGRLAHLQTALDVALGYHDTAVLISPQTSDQINTPLLETQRQSLLFFWQWDTCESYESCWIHWALRRMNRVHLVYIQYMSSLLFAIIKHSTDQRTTAFCIQVITHWQYFVIFSVILSYGLWMWIYLQICFSGEEISHICSARLHLFDYIHYRNAVKTVKYDYNLKKQFSIVICLFLWYKAEFSASFLQSLVLHNSSEIILIFWFAAL